MNEDVCPHLFQNNSKFLVITILGQHMETSEPLNSHPV